MTTVVNIFGGSGIGKSTTAAHLFVEMKMQGIHCELVREYVKNWAWRGEKVGPFDQIYLLGKQARYESTLYGRVDFIITDSPLLLCPMYEKFYAGTEVIKDSALNFIKDADGKGVKHLNFLLTRQHAFDPRGRFETAEGATKVDGAIKDFLTQNDVDFIEIKSTGYERAPEILKHLV